ncbi:hypothetical protein [Legionella busanensis]|nr:hypothetical protein [Legionella busanensis]
MKKILDNLDGNPEQIGRTQKKIAELRKYSDIAEIVANPKNLNVGLMSERTPHKERAQFNTFNSKLSEAKREVAELVRQEKGIDINVSLRDVFDGRKSVEDLGLDLSSGNQLKA